MMRHLFSDPRHSLRQFKSVRLIALALFLAAVTGLASSSRAEGPDLSTPKKAGAAFARALMAGDMDAVKLTATGSDSEFAIVKSMGDMALAMKRYEAAAIKKFGDEGKMSKDDNKDLAAEVEAADEKVDGSTATLINKADPNDKNPMTLKKDANGNWKVDLSTLSKDPDSAKILDMSKATVKTIDAAIKDVEAGKYKTAKDAKEAMGTAMFAALQAIQGTK